MFIIEEVRTCLGRFGLEMSRKTATLTFAFEDGTDGTVFDHLDGMRDHGSLAFSNDEAFGAFSDHRIRQCVLNVGHFRAACLARQFRRRSIDLFWKRFVRRVGF